MADGDTIAQVAVVILLLSLSVPALATAYDYAGTPFDYDESLTVDYSNLSEVSENATDAEAYDESVRVTVDGSNLTEDTDYRWYESNGTVEWINTTATSEGDSAQIYYTAYQRTAESNMAWQLIAPFMALFGLFGLASAVRAVWEYTAEVWDLV